MFIMALIGMICYRIGLISGHTNEKLSDILLLLVSPLLIFTSYQQAFDPEKLNGLLAAFFMAAVSHAVAIATAAFLVKREERTGRLNGYPRSTPTAVLWGFHW